VYCEIALEASSLVAGEARDQQLRAWASSFHHAAAAAERPPASARGGVNVIDMLLAVRDDPVRSRYPTDHHKWISDISISHSFLGGHHGRQNNAFQISLCHMDDELCVCLPDKCCARVLRLPPTLACIIIIMMLH